MYDLFMAFLGVLFDLDIAMILLGVLGLIFCSLCGWHVAIGFSGSCYAYFRDGIWYDILEYYVGCHVAFGLLVASVSFIMMPVDIMLWSMMMEMMLACGSKLDS